MLWMQWRRMKRCRGCGDVFAFNHHAEWYCSICRAARATKRTRLPKPTPPVVAVSRKNAPWAGVRAAEVDAKLALAELRAWTAKERSKW
jgi:hypothetical protein